MCLHDRNHVCPYGRTQPSPGPGRLPSSSSLTAYCEMSRPASSAFFLSTSSCCAVISSLCGVISSHLRIHIISLIAKHRTSERKKPRDFVILEPSQSAVSIHGRGDRIATCDPLYPTRVPLNAATATHSMRTVVPDTGQCIQRQDWHLH